jgi:hypothetical protein
LAGSAAGLSGNSHGTRGSFQACDDCSEKEKAPNRSAAFKRRGSFTKVSSNWSYNKELFEIVAGRTRFFFDNPEKSTYYPSLSNVVNALQATVVKLAGTDGPGQLLVVRAESQLEATYPPPSSKGQLSHPKLNGLYGFLRDSLDLCASLNSTKALPTRGNTAPPTPTGTNQHVNNGTMLMTPERLSPVLALSLPQKDILTGGSVDLPEVVLQVDTIITSIKQSGSHGRTYLTVVEPEQLTQLQRLGGNRSRPLESNRGIISDAIGTRQYRRFEGFALMPYDLLSRSMSFRASSAEANTVSTKSAGDDGDHLEAAFSTDVVSSMSSRRTGVYMHPVDSVVLDVLEDIYKNRQRAALPDADSVLHGTMPADQDKRVKVPAAQLARQNSAKIVPIAHNLTVNTTVAIAASASSSPNGTGSAAVVAIPSVNHPLQPLQLQPQWVQDEAHVECVGVQIHGNCFNTLSDFGYRQFLTHALVSK